MEFFENEVVNLVATIALVLVLAIAGSVIGHFIVFEEPESVDLSQVANDINSLRSLVIGSDRVVINIPDGSPITTSKSQLLVDIFESQIRSENAIVLNDLGEMGCQITNSFSIDADTMGISLVCPAA